MNYTRKDMHTFWGGWKHCFRFILREQGTSLEHLEALAGCIFYPILWPISYVVVYLGEKK